MKVLPMRGRHNVTHVGSQQRVQTYKDWKGEVKWTRGAMSKLPWVGKHHQHGQSPLPPQTPPEVSPDCHPPSPDFLLAAMLDGHVNVD